MLLGTPTKEQSHASFHQDLFRNRRCRGSNRSHGNRNTGARRDRLHALNVLEQSALHLVTPAAGISDRTETQADRDHLVLEGLCAVQQHLLEDRPMRGALELVCASVCTLASADLAAIGTPDESGDRVTVGIVSEGVGRRPRLVTDVGDRAESSMLADPVTREVLDRQVHATVAAWAPQTAWPPAAERGLDTRSAPAMLLPLTLRGDSFGVIIVRRAFGDAPFGADDVTLVKSFIDRALDVIGSERARRERHRLSLLEDRRRIGRDIHDVVVQRLYATGMRLQATAASAPSPRMVVDLRESAGELDTAIADLRSTVYELGLPQPIGSVGTRIQEVVRTQSAALGFEPTIGLSPNIETLKPLALEQLLPTLTEALANVAKHAAATEVTVRVDIGSSLVSMEVTDNGVGVAALDTELGHGIGNMNRRARRLGGACELSRLEPTGTSLVWTVPHH